MVGILGEWTSILEEEYEILDCLMAFVLTTVRTCNFGNLYGKAIHHWL
jgi:hypothetical protein